MSPIGDIPAVQKRQSEDAQKYKKRGQFDRLLIPIIQSNQKLFANLKYYTIGGEI